MKKIIAFILCLYWINTGQAQKIIWADDAEVMPLQSQMDWWHPKTQGPNVWTGGSQDLDNQLSSNTMKVVSVGQFGAPAPLRGSKSYQLYMQYIGYGVGLQHARNEWHYGAGWCSTDDTRWIQAAVYLPSSGFYSDDPAPTQIMYDMKFGDGQGPASFSLWVQNGEYVVQQEACHDCGGTYENFDDLAPTESDVDHNVWVSFVCERNFEDDGTGFIRLYKFKHGVSSVPTLVWEKYGPNFIKGCTESPDDSEPYYQMGLYKWSWDKSPSDNAGYPYDAAGRVSYTMYMDNIKFWRSSATLADITADLIGGGGSPTNQSPSVNAGPNQSIVSPDTDAVMAASASDPDGTIADYTWTQVSGPNTATISNDDIEDPTMSSLIAGTYIFRLAVTDDDGAVGVDDVQVTVSATTPSGGEFPYPTNSGNVETPTPDFTVHLPTEDTTIFFYADDPDDGSPDPYDWVKEMHVVKLSGPTGGTVTEVEQSGDNPTVFEVDFSDLEEGTYVYELEIIDFNGDQTTLDTFNIVVVGIDNLPPDANAGNDQYIPLDGFGAFITKSTTLIGVESDADGTVANIQWLVTNGPENSSLGSPSNDTTVFAGLIAGVYTVRFIVTDNDGATNYDEVNVTVLSVNAGTDQTISLPDNDVALVAVPVRTTDTTNVIWEVISGPVGSSFSQSGQLSTTFDDLTEGTYVVQVTVTWDIAGNIYTTRDRITIIVLPATTQNIYQRRVIKP